MAPQLPTVSRMMAYLSAVLLAGLLAFTLTLSLPDVQEMVRAPRPALSQKPPAIKSTFEHLRQLEDLGPVGDQIWNSAVLPREGGFLWVQANSTDGQDDREGWGITMFHALHCLQMVREVFKMAVVPSDPNESPQPQLSRRRSASHSHHVDPKHATHCFSYLYQVRNNWEASTLRHREDTDSSTRSLRVLLTAHLSPRSVGSTTREGRRRGW